jgi:hypothetical protein
VLPDPVRWVARHIDGFYAMAGLLLSAGLLVALLILQGLSRLTAGSHDEP